MIQIKCEDKIPMFLKDANAPPRDQHIWFRTLITNPVAARLKACVAA